jgi:hypothetical protein
VVRPGRLALAVAGALGGLGSPVGAHPAIGIAVDDPPPTPAPPVIVIARDPPPPPAAPSPPSIPAVPATLGVRMLIGEEQLGGEPMLGFGLGVAVDRPLGRGIRAVAEYALLVLDDRRLTMTGTAAHPDFAGRGHRGALGLRGALAQTTLGGPDRGPALRLFVDGELGAALTFSADSVTGDHVRLQAQATLYAGYVLVSSAPRSSSHEFGAELVFRALAGRDGVAALFGIGMTWGG